MLKFTKPPTIQAVPLVDILENARQHNAASLAKTYPEAKKAQQASIHDKDVQTAEPQMQERPQGINNACSDDAKQDSHGKLVLLSHQDDSVRDASLADRNMGEPLHNKSQAEDGTGEVHGQEQPFHDLPKLIESSA